MYATVVSDVFTQRKFTVGVGFGVIQHFDGAEVVGQDLGVGLEVLGVARLPPVAEVSILVVLTALIVEAMRHLV